MALWTGIHRKEAAKTTTVLANGAAYTSPTLDAQFYGQITVLVKASHASASNGLSIDQSIDGTNWDYSTQYTLSAGVSEACRTDLIARYVRVVLTNGATTQTYLRLAAMLEP